MDATLSNSSVHQRGLFTGNQQGNSTMNGNASDSGDEDAFLQSLGLKQNLKKGKELAAKAASSSKGGKDKAATGGGSFQSMALKPDLLRALLHRGFTTPTPIQRAALPSALAGRDIVGMARTGSGKTLAYMVPLIQRLGAVHSPRYGARALVLVPTRELALQVLKVGKDLARGANRGAHGKTKEDPAGGGAGSANEQLRWGLVVGGDSLDEQYNLMAGNPDILIATPGRLLHLLVEMNASLKSVEFLVFDEADRLFELGFETSLTEIISKLSPTRQTLLFSATLPKSLVEFAKAGLQNPKLVRLDAESKISNDLQMAFISVKPKEKEAALLLLLRDVIETPQASELPSYGEPVTDDDDDDDDRRRRGRDTMQGRDFNKRPSHSSTRGGRGGRFSGTSSSRPHQSQSWKGKKKEDPNNRDLLATQSIVFAATKHHVEYLSLLLVEAGYAVSSIYGSMDQAARRSQLGRFRAGKTSIMVVTDLAARGIDIPLLPNVVNYDFPASARTFVHRVGRTARAGRKGWAYSFITNSELAHLFDLQLFLGRPLIAAPTTVDDYANNLVLGTMPRERLDLDNDHFRSNMLEDSSTLATLLGVAEKGQKMYEKSQTKASQESYRRAKELVTTAKGLAGSEREEEGIHPIFQDLLASLPSSSTAASSISKPTAGNSRTDLLAQINAFRPAETVFEIGHRGKTAAAQIMAKRRVSLGKAKAKLIMKEKEENEGEGDHEDEGEGDEEEVSNADVGGEESMGLDTPVEELADEDDLITAFHDGNPAKKQKKDYRDPSVYMGYVQEGAEAERGYSLTGGDNFAAQAASTTYDLTVNDELGTQMAPQKASMLRWDRKHKKFVKGDGTGSDNKKLIRTESGGKLPASFKSGSFDDWKKKQKVFLPKIGEAELKNRQLPNRSGGPGGSGQRYRHNAVAGVRDPNAKPKRDGKGGFIKDTKDFKRKPGFGSKDAGDRDGKTRSSTSGRVRQSKGSASQLKTADQIRKDRNLKAKRVKRSTQPSKGKGKGKRK